MTYDELIKALKSYCKSTIKTKDINDSIRYTRMVNELASVVDESVDFERFNGFGRDYPGHPMVDESFILTTDENRVMQEYKAKKPFRSEDDQEWIDLLQQLFIDLAYVHGHKAPAIFHDGDWESNTEKTSFYTPHAVFLTGPRSLITALHEYTHSRGFGEVVAIWWSTNTFRLLFPESYAKLVPAEHAPHLLVRK